MLEIIMGAAAGVAIISAYDAATRVHKNIKDTNIAMEHKPGSTFHVSDRITAGRPANNKLIAWPEIKSVDELVEEQEQLLKDLQQADVDLQTQKKEFDADLDRLEKRVDNANKDRPQVLFEGGYFELKTHRLSPSCIHEFYFANYVMCGSVIDKTYQYKCEKCGGQAVTNRPARPSVITVAVLKHKLKIKEKGAEPMEQTTQKELEIKEHIERPALHPITQQVQLFIEEKGGRVNFSIEENSNQLFVKIHRRDD